MDLLTIYREDRERTQYKIAQANTPRTVLLNYVKPYRRAKVTMSAAVQNAVSFAWQNPESEKILVIRAVMYLVTQATLAATMNVGTSADAVTENNDIFAAQALNTTGIIDNLLVAGSGTGGVFKLDEAGGTTDYITGTVKSASSAGMVAYIYIEYITV